VKYPFAFSHHRRSLRIDVKGDLNKNLQLFVCSENDGSLELINKNRLQHTTTAYRCRIITLGPKNRAIEIAVRNQQTSFHM